MHWKSYPITTVRRLAVLAAGLCLAGCGNGAKLSLDENLARESLRTALDSWKQGDKPAALKERSPAIVMGDADWDAGKRLVGYTVRAKEFDDGYNLHCTVELVFAGNGDGSRRVVVTYIVGTSPVITIFRA
jgi:hypothetical protein